MSVDAQLRTSAEEWIADDLDDTTRDELTALLERAESDDAAAAELRDRFSGTLEFGTAGLRGALAAGPNRMNHSVVSRAAAGLAAYLTETAGPSRVAIGYDARHRSYDFACDTADIMLAAGHEPLLLPRALPTPVLAFAVLHLGCAAGVMVTASHNPPQDNGYKVYLGDGSQIVPPADADIAAQIDAVGAVREIPRDSGWMPLGDDVAAAYVEAVASLAGDGPRDVAAVYTPLHGVGADTVDAVVERSAFPALTAVAAQREPDPDFPTVAFPNPEEPGAIDLSLELAAAEDADVVVANDPDADRFAMAVPVPDGADTSWRMLRGDEVGALLADHLLRQGTQGTYATTIVSSSLLATMAAAHGQPYVETLTGFKWIGRVEGLVFGYEEALGYCVAPQLVRDKDGVSALLLALQLAASLKAEGSSVPERLDEIARTYGLHATDQLAVRVSDLSLIGDMMQRLRTAPPSSLGGLDVVGVDDLTAGTADLPPTDGLRFRLDDDARVVVRPSGTEPKLKCYLEVVVPVEAGDVDAARIAAATRLDAVRKDLSEALGV